MNAKKRRRQGSAHPTNVLNRGVEKKGPVIPPEQNMQRLSTASHPPRARHAETQHSSTAICTEPTGSSLALNPSKLLPISSSPSISSVSHAPVSCTKTGTKGQNIRANIAILQPSLVNEPSTELRINRNSQTWRIKRTVQDSLASSTIRVVLVKVRLALLQLGLRSCVYLAAAQCANVKNVSECW